MASPFRTLVLRLPAAPVARTAASNSMARCCATAPFSTVSTVRSTPSCTARVSLRQSPRQCQLLSVQRAFRSDLATAAQKSPNATNNKTAKDLESKPQIKPTPSSANVGVPPPGQQALDWNSFFKLRMRRRYFQLFCSVVSGIGAGAVGFALCAAGYAEPVVKLIPLDPFFTLGILTIAVSGLGWLIGPIVGTEIFYIFNRSIRTQMKAKESGFLVRVRKHRADPNNSSANNPVPDFYGEKIQSVKGYRRWLKDQRAFNKKKTAAFL